MLTNLGGEDHPTQERENHIGASRDEIREGGKTTQIDRAVKGHQTKLGSKIPLDAQGRLNRGEPRQGYRKMRSWKVGGESVSSLTVQLTVRVLVETLAML